MTAEQTSVYTNLISLTVVAISWCVFGYTILFGRKPHTPEEKSSAPKSWIGLALQLAGTGITFVLPRLPVASPLIAEQLKANIIFQIISIVSATLSAWLAMAAIKELGKQWSLQARVIEGHKLITTGVYGIVRHPIYTAMLGMLFATGIALSHWAALIVALIVFLIGTRIRTDLEEGLLRNAFGEELETWKAKVPGLIPRSMRPSTRS
ncbi:MAG: isoprenylcysteine carboxylmethyltransferase family protein [Pyrinomonadaceae bacterium]